MRDQVVAELQEWGWFINFEKSQLNPAQVVKWIGIVISTVDMRFYVPGEKVIKVEAAIQEFVGRPKEQTYRDLARIAGKIIAMGMAILPARMMTREFYTLIRPSQHDWDERIMDDVRAVVRQMVWWLKHLRVWNAVGAPIRPDNRMQQLRLWVDAGTNFGYRLDGGEDWSDEWTDSSLGVAVDWEDGDAEMHHVHKELKALLLAVKREVERLRGKRVLVLVDAMATVRYIANGTGRSGVLRELTMQLWELCVAEQIGIWCEHVSGARMIKSGVDSLSRFHEFMIARRVFQMLDNRVGWGCYTIDMWASRKTKQVERWLGRGGSEGALGDARTFEFEQGDVVWAVPPVPMIQWTLIRLRQARVRATVVVPVWYGQAWFAWRQMAAHEMVLSWSRESPVCVDVAGEQHAHEANRWQFVAWSFDFREACGLQPPRPVGRSLVMTDISAGSRKQRRGVSQRGRQLKRSKGGIVVLSIFDGACGLAVACDRAGVPVSEYWRIETDEAANKVAGVRRPEARMVGSGDVEEVSGDEVGAGYPEWQRVGAVVFGFPCQDVSAANRSAAGLGGSRSRLFYNALGILRKIQGVNPRVKFVCECVARWADWLQADFASIEVALGVKPQVHDSADHSYCHRRRAIWADFEIPSAVTVGMDVNSILQAGRVVWPETAGGEAKLPTIVASVHSYSQDVAVYDYELGGWSPPTVTEAERAMELPEGYTECGGLNVVERWRLIGNGFNIGTFSRIMERLYLAWVRDAVSQSGSPFNENQDGPSELQKAITKMRRVRKVLRAVGAEPRQRAKAGRATMRVRAEGGRAGGEAKRGWPVIEAVPDTRVLSRQGGVKAASKMTLDQYVSSVRADLKVLSRAPSTWRSYAAWWGLFRAWLRERGMRGEFEWARAREELKNLVCLLEQKYAYSTLNILVTAVNAVVQDAGYESIRDRELGDLLKGVANHKGRTPRKKMAILPEHVRWILEMSKPGDVALLIWIRDIAIMMLGWYAFLRVMELMGVDACDLRWTDSGLVVHIRRAKADQSRDGRFTLIERGQDDMYCPLRRIRTYMRMAGITVKQGCTKGKAGCTVCNRPRCVCDCKECGPLFRKVLWRRAVISDKRVDHALVTKAIKRFFKELEEAGLVEKGTMDSASGISLRAGGVTSAAALNIERELLQGHGRWNAEMSVLHYDRGVLGRFSTVTKKLDEAVRGRR